MFRLRVLLYVLAFASTTLFCKAANRILFSGGGPRQATLFISNADGSAERPLTKPGSLNYDPAWSPKGDWIAFTSGRAGSADLYRIHPDGTGLDRLTKNPAFDDQAAFSPDGKQIVFVSTRAAGFANLWILDIVTRKARPLTSEHGGDFRPAWSPDGKWIAFSSDHGSDAPEAKGRWERMQLVDIYIIRPDGTGLKRISEHGNFCGGPKWTHDSKSVVAYCMSAEETFTFRIGTGGDTSLVKIDIVTGKVTPLAAGPGVKISPSVLPSGEVAYVRRNNPASGVFYADGNAGPAGRHLFSPSWSPDGAHVVYSRYSRGSSDPSKLKKLRRATTTATATAFLRSSDPSKLRKLWSRNPKYELYATVFLPSCAWTGQHCAATQMNPDHKSSSLFVIDEGKPARPIFQQKGLILGPQWSFDGRQIVFGTGNFTAFLDFTDGTDRPIDPADGGAQVGIVNADGSGFHLVTSGPNNNAFASFAPDGKRIVYRTAGPDGDGLRIMDLYTHKVTLLTNEYDNFPVWSPRGNLIAFVRKIDGKFKAFTIRPDGKDLRQLTANTVPGDDAHLAWSPDGEQLVFTSGRMGFKDEAPNTPQPQPYGEIFVMKYDGTQVEQITDNQWEDGGPTWQPDPPTSTIAITRSK